MNTEIQPDKDNFTEDSELNENWHSTRQRHFYRRLRIKWKLKFNPTKTILRNSELNENSNSITKDNFTEASELNENWNSTRQRQFYRRLRIKLKLKLNLRWIILQKTGLNENWNSIPQRHFYGILRIKWKLKFNLTKTILRNTQN